jgi:hypothetical protein
MLSYFNQTAESVIPKKCIAEVKEVLHMDKPLTGRKHHGHHKNKK